MADVVGVNGGAHCFHRSVSATIYIMLIFCLGGFFTPPGDFNGPVAVFVIFQADNVNDICCPYDILPVMG